MTKIEELCGCGSKFAIEHDQVIEANDMLHAWRSGHKCRPASAMNGSSTSFGFVHAAPRPLNPGDGAPFRRVR